MKTILVPTDFSENAYAALQYATHLVAEEICQIIIVHSFEDQVTQLTSRIDIGKTEAVVDEFYSTYEAKCDEIKQKISVETKYTNHTYKTIATSLSLSRAINKLIIKEEVDFVIMGSKGSTGASDILMGSNTLAMIRKIKNSPLLVIPQKFIFKPIQNIAFATGFKRSYSQTELQPVRYIASLYNAKIKVTHVQKLVKKMDKHRVHFHQLFKLLEDYSPENINLSGEGDTYDTLSSYLNSTKIDLLAMIYYKHNFLVSLFREATVKDIAKYTRIPFLILPTRD